MKIESYIIVKAQRKIDVSLLDMNKLIYFANRVNVNQALLLP